MTRILIVDDHPILRQGLREILNHEIKNGVFEEAENAQQALVLIRRQAWDLVILDIGMPGRSGLDALQEIKALQPKVHVLVLSVYSEQQYGKRALQAGASGYVNKASLTDELLKAVHRVLAGGRYVGPALAEWLALDLGVDPKRAPHDALSDRELEVLRMVGSGRTISQIADDLHLSVTTVSTYRARILEKMHMTTTAELMHYALVNKISN